MQMIINTLIGLIVITIVISTLYAIGLIAERVLALHNLDYAERYLVGFIIIVGIGLLGLLACSIGAEVMH